MRHFIYLFFLSTLFSLTSCNSNSNSKAKTAQSAPAATAPVTPTFRAVPNDMMMSLWNECDLIDYIFHNLPFSMNQSEQASIRTNITYISSTAQGTIPANCKPMGRQFYSIAGNIVMEADIYYSDECMFYVFFIDGKATYANQMSDSGKKFFQTMIAKGMDARKGMAK